MKNRMSYNVIIAMLSIFAVSTAQAGDKTKTATLDCARSSLSDAISSLDRTISNVIEFTGNCVEDILVEGHRDLTLIGLDGASITATAFDPGSRANSTNAFKASRSKVTIESVTFNGGNNAFLCDNRSDCVLRDVNSIGGWFGLVVQSQSSADVIGSGNIIDSLFAGIGVFGNSSMNLRPTWANGFDNSEASYTISGHFYGAFVQDGGFFRADNAQIENNSEGVVAQRGAIVKILSGPNFGVTNNVSGGVTIRDNSTAQISTRISGNPDFGLSLGALSSMQVSSPGLITDGILCVDDTARSDACP